jgi:hypothetical protein
MERLRTERPKGLTCAGIRKWGMLFLILGLFGRSIILNRYLGIAHMSGDQLLQAMDSGPGVMTAVTFALISKFLEACGVPLFCFLLAEGMVHTANAPKYLLRVLGVALLSEIPYNFAMTGNLFDMSSRNPVFGMLMALFLLYLYTRYGEKKMTNLLLKAAFTVATVFWTGLLRIESGVICVFLSAVFWGFRKKPNIRTLMGAVAAMLCSFFSVFFMVVPMSMMVLHFYNGEKGEENRLVSYLFYPVVLTILGIIGALAF